MDNRLLRYGKRHSQHMEKQERKHRLHGTRPYFWEPQTLQPNTAAPQICRSVGTAALHTGRLFSYPKTKPNNFDSRIAAESEDYIWNFSTAQ